MSVLKCKDGGSPALRGVVPTSSAPGFRLRLPTLRSVGYGSRMKKQCALPGRLGFSLIEILVVLGIMMSLAGLVAVNVIRHRAESKAKEAALQMSAFKTALKIYHVEQGRYPTQTQGLSALVQRPTAPPVPANYPVEGYLDSRRIPLDPWGAEYIYLAPGRRGEPYEIITYGSDLEPGGEGHAADLTSAEL